MVAPHDHGKDNAACLLEQLVSNWRLTLQRLDTKGLPLSKAREVAYRHEFRVAAHEPVPTQYLVLERDKQRILKVTPGKEWPPL